MNAAVVKTRRCGERRRPRERDVEDRCRALVRALPEVERRMAPLCASPQQSMLALWSRYSAQELPC